MKKLVTQRKWLVCSACLLFYTFLCTLAAFHNEYMNYNGEQESALVQDFGHRDQNSVLSMDAVPVMDPADGRLTSLLRPERQYVVPNVVHYVWYGDHETLKFHQYLSVRSAFTFLQPDKVIVHYSHPPVGSLWKQLQHFIKQHNDKGDSKPWVLELKQSTPPSSIQGHDITLMGHKSDIARMQILLEEGGIFLDLDVIVLKSFDPLRRYNFSMGIEYFGHPGRLNNGIILARPNASFLHKWIEKYKDFSKSEWDVHSSQVPYELQFHYPNLIHVERDSLNYPSGEDIELIYEQRYDWSRNYALHLWHKIHDLEHGPQAIRTMNTTFGEVTRLVFYGSKDLLPACDSKDKGNSNCPK